LLINTFRHLRGIGPAREAALWQAGCRTWHQLQAGHPAVDEVLPRGLVELARTELERDLDGLGRLDAAWFGARLKPALQWRTYRTFGQRAAMLDIETTGTDRRADRVTMVGVYREDRGAELFVDGLNLDGFPEALQGVDMLVSFNGAAFDVPFLKGRFPGWRPPPLHVDLRWLAHRLGLKGGLKRVERILGLERSDDLADLDGWDAVRLWRRWRQRGELPALQTLARYNLADVINLRWVATGCIDRQMADLAGLDPEPLGDPGPILGGRLRVGEKLDLVVEPDGSVKLP